MKLGVMWSRKRCRAEGATFSAQTTELSGPLPPCGRKEHEMYMDVQNGGSGRNRQLEKRGRVKCSEARRGWLQVRDFYDLLCSPVSLGGERRR